jgi:hypothetical protein
MLVPLSQVPRHQRQGDYESLFDLGSKELLLKTYSASINDSDDSELSGKLWISLNYVCFSSGSLRVAIPFTGVKEFRSSGWRSVEVSGPLSPMSPLLFSFLLPAPFPPFSPSPFPLSPETYSCRDARSSPSMTTFGS